MIRFENNKVLMVRGDHGGLKVNISGYELQEGDSLIFNVREYPNDDSPLVFSSVNFSDVIRIRCVDTEEAIPGSYSAQLFLNINDGECPIQIWPVMDGTPSPRKNLKNFIIYPEV